MTEDSRKFRTLSDLLPSSALDLLAASGDKFVQQIGLDVVRNVVYDVLTGRNLRDSTEMLTRRRIAMLNLATVGMLIQGAATSDEFIEDLPRLAAEILQRKKISRMDRWLAQWVLGLTDKAFQNVLRDDPQALDKYRDRYIAVCQEAIAQCERERGKLAGVLELETGPKTQVNWLFLTYLLNTVGAQTLAIRGSEKSAYGKLFEKLVLGSLLHILGFKHRPIGQPGPRRRVFWLSSRGERRESDATLLYRAGRGVRFDIGFIGRGNPEISLDKVSRFERQLQLGRSKWYMATIIIVDRIGPGSKIEEKARDMDGTIIQMSMAYWPQLVAQELERVLGYKHELAHMEETRIAEYLHTKLIQVPLEDFLPFVTLPIQSESGLPSPLF